MPLTKDAKGRILIRNEEDVKELRETLRDARKEGEAALKEVVAVRVRFLSLKESREPVDGWSGDSRRVVPQADVGGMKGAGESGPGPRTNCERSDSSYEPELPCAKIHECARSATLARRRRSSRPKLSDVLHSSPSL